MDEPSQAEQMIRRVSPEGRALARREAAARARARRPVLMAAIATALILMGMLVAGAPALAVVVSALVLLAATALVAFQTRPRPVSADILVRQTDVRQLPDQAKSWLAGQRRALPAPAVQLTDSLSRRLDDLAPQLARLAPEEPAAAAVRKLVATELPSLVEGYRAVPASLRGQPGPTGRSADAQLLDGLTVIDGEVARMTEQLARGALDEVATQGRYLELKYRGEI